MVERCFTTWQARSVSSCLNREAREASLTVVVFVLILYAN